MNLTLRPTVILDTKNEDNYCVYDDGRRIGRILRSNTPAGSWDWMINIPISIPAWCVGSAASLDEAKAAFKAAWEKFLPTLTEHALEEWRNQEQRSETQQSVTKGAEDASDFEGDRDAGAKIYPLD